MVLHSTLALPPPHTHSQAHTQLILGKWSCTQGPQPGWLCGLAQLAPWVKVITYFCNILSGMAAKIVKLTPCPLTLPADASHWALVCAHVQDPGVPWQQTSQLLNLSL